MAGRGSTRAWRVLALAGLLAVIALAGAPGSAHAGGCQYADRTANQLSAEMARKAIRCQVNAHRRATGIAGLDHNWRLQRAASRHTRVMTSQNCFAHQCPGEGSLSARLWSVGYLTSGLRFWGYGENIAWGRHSSSTPRRIVRAWMNSSSHRAMILNRGFEHLGVGFVRGAPTSYDAGAGTYTIDLGYRG
jgi:uncharacterized protein YkwD